MRREHLQGGIMQQTAEHMIGSGSREYSRHEAQFVGNAPPPHSKYYQTFNESRGGEPTRNHAAEPGVSSSSGQRHSGHGEEPVDHMQRMANSHLVAGGRGAEDLYHG